VRTALKLPERKTLASIADTTYSAAEMVVGLVRLRGRDIKPKRLEPIWPGVLYKGKVVIFAGLPGDGKSAMTCDIVARITTGGVWPCSIVRAKAGYALLLTAEDDPEDTIRPRMDVAGADPDKYEIVTGVRRVDAQTGETTLDTVSLIADLPKIETAIMQTGAVALVVDPLTSFATSDTNKTADMRRLLDSLADVARRTGCCIVIVTHLNKRADARRAMHMIAGSHVIVAAVRTAFATARDPNDPARRLLLPLKLNIAKEDGGFAFRMEDAQHDVCGSTPRVVWESDRVNDLSADDALIDQTPRAQASVEKSAEVQAWLTELLRHGAVEARTMWRQAEEHGYNERRVRQALKHLKAECEVKGYQGKWHYWLPQSPAGKDVP
jgi:KaiC/GvpD/RAD55 family RecA-like ATPase